MRSHDGDSPPRRDESRSDATAERRRPYEAPRVLHRESLEALASTCDDAGGKADLIHCPSGPLQS